LASKSKTRTSRGGDVAEAGKFISSRDEEQNTKQQIPSSQITNAVGDVKFTSILGTKKDTHQAEIHEKIRSVMLELYPDNIR